MGSPVGVVALLVLLSANAAADERTEALKRVVNRNTGFAHMTRGVNMYALIAGSASGRA